MINQSPVRKLILASSSPYRKMLLERLGLPFETNSPDVDESRTENESPERMVARLADDKARVVASRSPAALVIGSDQVATFDGRIVGKPGTAGKATAQLRAFSGRTVTFLTAVSVICAETGFRYRDTVETRARFRELDEAEIRRYIDTDRPLDCAGSFKSEAAGITLLESLSSPDPTAIVGLPLIAVSAALRRAGLDLP